MKKLIRSRRTSANDLYDFYSFPEKLVRYKHEYYLTLGIYDIGNDENCFTILDIICHHKENFNYEIWEFKRNIQNLFSLTAKDKFGNEFVRIPNIQSDFYFDDLIIVKKGKVLYLPSEESIYMQQFL